MTISTTTTFDFPTLRLSTIGDPQNLVFLSLYGNTEHSETHQDKTLESIESPLDQLALDDDRWKKTNV